MAPEIALLATPSRTLAASAGAGYRLNDDVQLSLEVRRESIASSRGVVTLPFLPAGDRTATTVRFQISLEP